jgi:hypothetical protein
MREQALREQTTMRAETERLRESRGRMIEYLGRIHNDLGALLAEAAQPAVEAERATEEPSVNGERVLDQEP